MTRVALVTGANRGIGKDVCRQLAQQDITTLLTARSLEKARAAATDLAFESIVPAQLDVTDAASIEALCQRVTKEFGRLDVLVNNAAINYDTRQHAVNTNLDSVRDTMETNVYGPWRMVQAFLPLLKKSEHPRIVNVSSGAGALTSMSGGTPAYSMSKAALNALTRMLAAELRRHGILVNSICPGWVATDMGGAGGRPVADGAKGIVWAALLPDDGPTGGFFRDGQPLDW
jgi:NAD(P)-dependent dehydrogenase (short-subunit alcohol dehydrogenase family)